MSKRESRWALLWAVIVVGLTCLPYFAAWWLAPTDMHYTGLLVNPLDGETYLAKMQQGARGDWLFHLPFTPEPHDGVFLLTFYLALGQLSALLHLPIPLVYHLARAAAGMFMLLVAYRFIARFFGEVCTRRAAFLLLAFSAGLGWLLAPLGVVAPDLWVAEGFTFLSILANPHFPLAIGLILCIFVEVFDRSIVPAAIFSLFLSVIQPLAVPAVLAVLAVYLVALAWQERRLPRHELVVAGMVALSAAPVMAYDFYVYRANPVMAAWSAQNLTPSPPAWEYAVGYGLILILAVAGLPAAFRHRRPVDLLVLSWLGAVVVLLYVPFALQRRFITGLHVPLAILAAMGLEQAVWPRIKARRRALVTGVIVGLMTLSNLFVVLVAITGVSQGRRPLVMSSGEAAAWSWLHSNTAWTDTVLAPVDSGGFVPAWAGNRVVYGHPFETIDAETKKAEVTRFYSPDATTAERRALLEHYGVRYIFFDSSEAVAYSRLDAAALGLTQAWAGSGAILYRVEVQPPISWKIATNYTSTPLRCGMVNCTNAAAATRKLSSLRAALPLGGEAIPGVDQGGDCFAAKDAARNDGFLGAEWHHTPWINWRSTRLARDASQ